MSARELSAELRERIVPLLDADALDFFDTYFEADEWEISIGLAAETLFKAGQPLPLEVLDYEEEISSSVIEGIRQSVTAAV